VAFVVLFSSSPPDVSTCVHLYTGRRLATFFSGCRCCWLVRSAVLGGWDSRLAFVGGSCGRLLCHRRMLRVSCRRVLLLFCGGLLAAPSRVTRAFPRYSPAHVAGGLVLLLTRANDSRLRCFFLRRAYDRQSVRAAITAGTDGHTVCGVL